MAFDSPALGGERGIGHGRRGWELAYYRDEMYALGFDRYGEDETRRRWTGLRAEQPARDRRRRTVQSARIARGFQWLRSTARQSQKK
jgi:hypothetical protein